MDPTFLVSRGYLPPPTPLRHPHIKSYVPDATLTIVEHPREEYRGHIRASRPTSRAFRPWLLLSHLTIIYKSNFSWKPFHIMLSYNSSFEENFDHRSKSKPFKYSQAFIKGTFSILNILYHPSRQP